MSGHSWTFRASHTDEYQRCVVLAMATAKAHGAELGVAHDPQLGRLLRALLPDEERAQAFWLLLHERADEAGLGIELVTKPVTVEPLDWRPLDKTGQLPEDDGCDQEENAPADAPAATATVVVATPSTPPLRASDGGSLQMPRAERASPAGYRSRDAATEGSVQKMGGPAAPTLQRYRPPIPNDSLYDLLGAEDPELAGRLAATIAAIEDAGLPVVNLLSYLDLPLFQEYAAAHEDERDQNLFLHMLHTWTCYRRFGEVHARLPEPLAAALCDSRYLRINTTMFQSPVPALCVQLPAWWCELRGVGHASRPTASHWVKEIYLTHCEPPTPADDRELTLMIVTHDERAQFGFVPLELPLSLPSVEQSVDAFFAPSLEDADLGANSQDLRRATVLAAAYCLYATARDPQRYLGA